MSGIRLICKTLRWFVVGVSVLAAVYVIGSYIDSGVYNFGSDSTAFKQLWDHPKGSQWILVLLTSPGLFLWMAMVYWLLKLLGHFEKGEYFSEQSIHCFLWLVWINGIKFLAQMVTTLALAYYHSRFYDDTSVSLSVDLGELFTLTFMIVIVHILKAARQIELENKEFI